MNYMYNKYPNEGYKKPEPRPISWMSLGYKALTMTEDEKKKVIDDENEYNNIPKGECIYVCECGNEWKSADVECQLGCYPYIMGTCNECLEKAKQREYQERILEENNVKMEEFNNLLPPRFRNKLNDLKYPNLIDSTCSIVAGDFGMGKTWEAYTLAKSLLMSGKIETWKHVTEVSMMNELRYASSGFSSVVDRYNNYDFLIVDEAGKANNTDFTRGQLFDILNYRYDWEKKTIVICNARDIEELLKLIPTATVDRYRECIIFMNGKSKRYSK